MSAQVTPDKLSPAIQAEVEKAHEWFCGCPRADCVDLSALRALALAVVRETRKAAAEEARFMAKGAPNLLIQRVCHDLASLIESERGEQEGER